MKEHFDKGHIVYQKWTCAKCGERVTANIPNMITQNGRHEEKADGSPCGHITDCAKAGGNYMLIMARRGTK